MRKLATYRSPVAASAMVFCLVHPAGIVAQESGSAHEVTVLEDIPFTEGFLLDVYVPDGSGPFPVAVTLHGASGRKAAMNPIAGPLARLGWIVFNAQWLAPERPIGAAALERSFDAAGCAIRFAAATAAEHNGDGGPLTVVGLSAGGLAGALVSLEPTEFGQACGGAAQAPRVSRFVGLEGAYLNAAEGSGGLAPAIRERPQLATRLDPRTYLEGPDDLEVVLWLGDEYQPAVPGTQTFYEALRAAGVSAEIRRTTGPHRASTFVEGVLELLGSAHQRRPRLERPDATLAVDVRTRPAPPRG